ncbi:MAG TPA: alpha/beta hydrolase-fold protein [Polyangiaceae bacterium]|nr:alpha/beta hydrolase-fold protein [Polyangiaceae bacterium]
MGAGLGACSSDEAPTDMATAGTTSVTNGGTTAGSAIGGTAAGNAAAGTSSGGSDAAGSSSTSGSSAGGASGGTAGGSAGGAAGSGGTTPDVSPEGDGDFEVGPTYTKDPNLTDQQKPKGKKFSFSMSSADSAIYKGDDATLSKPANKQVWNRSITVYVPALYKDGDEAAVLVIQDGPGPIDSISRALDNLTISTDPLKKLPPFVAVAVQNGSDRDGADGQGSERGLEYDTMSDRYSRFIDTEVLPAVVANAQIKAAYPGLKFTRNPEGRGAFGCSSGGAAALSMGWFVPDLWRRIITYSGTFVDQQNHAQTAEVALFPFGAWEYHSDKKLIETTTPNKPLRIFLNVNENDNGKGRPEADHHDWIVANQRTAAALKAKSYHYRYVFGKGVGHCAGQVQDATIAEALSWAWRGYAGN